MCFYLLLLFFVKLGKGYVTFPAFFCNHLLICNYEIASPAEAILLGFQHYLVMLGTTVLIPASMVPQMGGGNVS